MQEGQPLQGLQTRTGHGDIASTGEEYIFYIFYRFILFIVLLLHKVVLQMGGTIELKLLILSIELIN